MEAPAGQVQTSAQQAGQVQASAQQAAQGEATPQQTAQVQATAQEAAEVQAPAQQGGLDEYDVLPSYDLTNFSSMISTHFLSLRKYFQCFTCN